MSIFRTAFTLPGQHDQAMGELFAGRIPTTEIHAAGIEYARAFFGLDHDDALFAFLGVNA